MHRFYLPPDCCAGETLQLTEGEAHHAVRVLRIQRGEAVLVVNGSGRQFFCTVVDANRARVDLKIVEIRNTPQAPWEITLAQALPKGRLIDSIVQKATELGVRRIVPLLTERVVAHLDEEGAAHKTEKWRQVAIEAIKQCGSGWLPTVEPPIAFSEFVDRREAFDLALTAALQPGSKHLRTLVQAYCERDGRPPRSICIWVGPEGDFTAAEYAALEGAGALPISLGHLVLRVETAAIYSLAVINHELQFATGFGSKAQFVA